MASVISNVLGGNLLDGISKVINAIRGKSPEDAAKLEELKQQYQQEFLAAQVDLAKASMNQDVALNQAATSAIEAEAKENWYSAAARPSVIWVGLVLLVWNYGIVGPIGRKYGLVMVDFPEWFWSAWKVISPGYVFSRSADKAGIAIFGGAGGSIKLPGITMNSLGDKK